jgi:hypothetical protein
MEFDDDGNGMQFNHEVVVEDEEQDDGDVVMNDDELASSTITQDISEKSSTNSVSKKEKFYRSIIILPQTRGRNAIWKDRFVTDNNNKWYYLVYFISYIFRLFSYYCVIDKCCTRFKFPTSTTTAMRHVRLKHKAVFYTIEEEERELQAILVAKTNSDASSKIGNQSTTNACRSIDSNNNQMSMDDYTCTAYKTGHHKYIS